MYKINSEIVRKILFVYGPIIAIILTIIGIILICLGKFVVNNSNDIGEIVMLTGVFPLELGLSYLLAILCVKVVEYKERQQEWEREQTELQDTT